MTNDNSFPNFNALVRHHLSAQEAYTRALEIEVEETRAAGVAPAFEYFCQNRRNGSCRLASVYIIEGRHVAYLDRYTLPKSKNDAVSTAEKRKLNTENNGNKWRARVIDLDQLTSDADTGRERGQLGMMRVPVRCKHSGAWTPDGWIHLDPADMIEDADGPERHDRLPRG